MSVSGVGHLIRRHTYRHVVLGDMLLQVRPFQVDGEALLIPINRSRSHGRVLDEARTFKTGQDI
jgi:hypothetical protein